MRVRVRARVCLFNPPQSLVDIIADQQQWGNGRTKGDGKNWDTRLMVVGVVVALVVVETVLF